MYRRRAVETLEKFCDALETGDTQNIGDCDTLESEDTRQTHSKHRKEALKMHCKKRETHWRRTEEALRRIREE